MIFMGPFTHLTSMDDYNVIAVHRLKGLFRLRKFVQDYYNFAHIAQVLCMVVHMTTVSAKPIPMRSGSRDTTRRMAGLVSKLVLM